MGTQSTAAVLAAVAVMALTVPARAEKTRVAVLDLQGKGVDADLAGNLTDVVTVALNELGVFEVLSRTDIQQMLQYEQQKQVMGCDDASCLAEIGGALGVGFLVSGSIGKVGSSYIINLNLTDAGTVKVLARAQRQVHSEDELTERLTSSVKVLMRPLLEGQQGELILTTAETGAEVEVDGRMIGMTPLGRQVLAGGPHTVEVHKKGFVSWARDVEVQPDQPLVIDAALVPSIEFIEDYEAGAFRWRLAAYLTGGLGAALLGAGIGGYAYNSGEISAYERDLQATNCQVSSVSPPTGDCSQFESRKSNIESLDQAMVGMMVGGSALVVAGVVLFLYGPEPGVYDDFKGSGARAGSDVSVDARLGVLPLPGGVATSATLRF